MIILQDQIFIELKERLFSDNSVIWKGLDHAETAASSDNLMEIQACNYVFRRVPTHFVTLIEWKRENQYLEKLTMINNRKIYLGILMDQSNYYQTKAWVENLNLHIRMMEDSKDLTNNKSSTPKEINKANLVVWSLKIQEELRDAVLE